MLSTCATSFDAKYPDRRPFPCGTGEMESLCDIRIVLYDATLNIVYEGRLVRKT